MRSFVCLVAVGLIGAGCANVESKRVDRSAMSRSQEEYVTEKKPDDQAIVTPATVLKGRVVRVNNEGRFAVLSFPVGSLPATNVRLNIYREGLKVGEMKVTGPEQDDNTVADIVVGEARVGDEVRVY
jgi:hypothetical protein